MDEAQTKIESLQEILEERARILSEVPATEDGGEKISILSFQLYDELYGVELGYLTETRQSVSIRHVPCAPSHLIGIINLRGELLPVVDLCPILGLPQQPPRKIIPALLVLSLRGNKLAFVADQARDILTFAKKDIKPIPLSLESERAVFVRGELLVENRLISLLDVEKLLQDPRFTGEVS